MRIQYTISMGDSIHVEVSHNRNDIDVNSHDKKHCVYAQITIEMKQLKIDIYNFEIDT